MICCQASDIGALDDQLRDFGEPVAHLHHRQNAREIRDGHAENRRPLELSQRLDLPLRIVLLRKLIHHHIELVGELSAIGQIAQQALVEQLIEQ